jgi:peptide/nickel transport system permease protein
MARALSAELPATPRRPVHAGLIRSRLLLAGLVIVCLLSAAALGAERLAPRDPVAVDIGAAFRPPGPDHPLGTDRFGRDLLSRVIFGCRISLGVAFSSVGAALVIGGVLGLIAGFFGGYVDLLISRLVDIVGGFPPLLLAIGVTATLGPGIENAVLAIALVYTPFFVRVMRAPVLVEREKEYVLAARAVGCRPERILLRHVLPNSLAPVIIQATVTVAYAILTEASLSYLGLGAQPPTPSWGTILNEGRTYLQLAPWVSVFPGLCIMLAVLAFNLVGDGLRDALDPRLI